MRRFATALALSLALFGVARAQGVTKPTPARPASLWSAQPGALGGSLRTGGYYQLEAPFRFTKMSFDISTASGGGAGNTVLTVTDGTNTCTFTLACATSQSLGVYSAAATNGAGTGCVYAAGAVISSTVTTAGCTTTQPTPRIIVFTGYWQ